jgi:hypothetical protein
MDFQIIFNKIKENAPDDTADPTGNGTGEEFHVKGGILSSPKEITDRRIGTEFDTGVRQFPSIGKEEALPKSRNALGLHQTGDGNANASTAHLHAGFDGFLFNRELKRGKLRVI